MSQLSPEAELLILLARQDLDDVQLVRAKELTGLESPITDWGNFLDLAVQHRVAQLIGSHARKLLGSDRAPGSTTYALMLLQDAYLAGISRSRVIGAELARILDACTGLQVAVRKGAHLAFQIYGDPGLRPMGDFDLLVTRQTGSAVVAVLQAIGYVEGRLDDDGQIQPLTRKQRLFWQLYGSDLPTLTRHGDNLYTQGFSVDVNIELTLPGKGPQVPVNEFLDRAVSGRIGRSSCLMLSPEDTIIDLSLHLYKNSTALRFMKAGRHRRLSKYVDLAEFLSYVHNELDWHVLMQRVAALDVTEPIYFALAHLVQLFPGSVPENVLTRLRSGIDDPENFLQAYGQWDLIQPMHWQAGFLERLFDKAADAELPLSRSLV